VQHLGDRRGQCGLAVVDVSNGADVDCGLVRSNLAFATGYLLVAIVILSCDGSGLVLPRACGE